VRKTTLCVRREYLGPGPQESVSWILLVKRETHRLLSKVKVLTAAAGGRGASLLPKIHRQAYIMLSIRSWAWQSVYPFPNLAGAGIYYTTPRRHGGCKGRSGRIVEISAMSHIVSLASKLWSSTLTCQHMSVLLHLNNNLSPCSPAQNPFVRLYCTLSPGKRRVKSISLNISP
jgi:hypothetical protein